MCRCLLILTVALGLCQPSALLGQKQETQTAAPSEVSGPAGSPTVTVTPAAFQGGNGEYQVGGEVSKPVPLYSPGPSYPKRARKAKLQGIVVRQIVVDAEGKVRDVRVTKPLGMGLDESAVRTVRTWKFRPAMRHNVPVPVQRSVEIHFLSSDNPAILDLTQRYLMLTTRTRRGKWSKKHATLQKQLDEASSAGYRVLSFGRNRRDEMSFLLEKVSGNGAGVQLQSLLLAAKGIENLQDEVCGAAAKGFRLALPTLMTVRKFGNYIMVMEKTAIPQDSCPYMFVATKRTSRLEKEVNEAAEQGYEVVGMASPLLHVAILEKTGETHRELTTLPDPTQRYLLLATSKTSTMQKELHEAAAAGFRVSLGFSTFMSGSMGGEAALLLEKAAVPTTVPEYLLLADGRLSKLQEELNQAASNGFRLLPRTLMMKPHYFSSRAEIVVVLEKSPSVSKRVQYLLLESKHKEPTDLQTKLSQAIEEGYELIGLPYSENFIAILEKPD